MKISVIVTCYNHEKYIVQCLDSILTNRVPDIELIICDDFSSDNSVEIVEQWLNRNADCFENTQLIRHAKNEGVTASLNELISLCRGDIISPLASDDYYLPNTLAKRRDFFIKNKKMMGAFTDGIAVGLQNEVFSKSMIHTSNLRKYHHTDLGFKEQVLFRWSEPMNLQCWRRDVFKIHGGNFKFDDVYCEDLDFALWGLSKDVFGYIDNKCYAYRCRTWPQTTPGNLSEKWNHMAYLYNKYSELFNDEIKRIMILRSNWLSSLAEEKVDDAEIFRREFGLSVIELEKRLSKKQKKLPFNPLKYFKYKE